MHWRVWFSFFNKGSKILNNIVRYINELIDQLDYVVIPGFGGFITSYAPARLFPFEGTALPPSKSIAFNSSLTNNDGLLVNHISAAEHIPVKEASEQVFKFAGQCKTTLQNHDVLMLPGIGRIFMDVEDHV